MNKKRYIFIVVILFSFCLLFFYCSGGVEIDEINNNNFSDNTVNNNNEDEDDAGSNNTSSDNENANDNSADNTNSNSNDAVSENIEPSNDSESNDFNDTDDNAESENSNNENSEENVDNIEENSIVNDTNAELELEDEDDGEDIADSKNENSKNDMLPNLIEEEKNSTNLKKNDESDINSDSGSSQPLLKVFQDYFGADDSNLTDINLFTEKKYTSDKIKKFSKGNDFYMFLPSDTVSESRDSDWNYLWKGEYQGNYREEAIPYYEMDNDDDITSEVEALDAEFNKREISVRFISIDRKIPSDTDDEYVTELFLGFLSTKQFSEDLGIHQWKFYFNENLDEIFKKKKISHSFVKSGLKHHPTDKKKYNEYYVFTFFSPREARLVFLITVFSFTKYVYKEMVSDGVLDSYYENWVSFISSFNFN